MTGGWIKAVAAHLAAPMDGPVSRGLLLKIALAAFVGGLVIGSSHTYCPPVQVQQEE